MKAIHPKWYPDCRVTCACGNSFTMGATVESMQIDICSSCHPFYTGQMKFIDTAGRVDAFKAKLAGASQKVQSKKNRRAVKREMKIKQEQSRPESLSELRKSLKKSAKSKKKAN